MSEVWVSRTSRQDVRISTGMKLTIAVCTIVMLIAVWVGRDRAGDILSSTYWFNWAGLLYFMGLFLQIAIAIQYHPNVRAGSVVAVATGFISQTIGMIFRWHEAGLVELSAVERAQDTVLTGMSRFVVYTQHPPWSNLFEIMVFMCWGIVLVFLVSEIKWRIPFLGIASLSLALTAFFLATLSAPAAVKPLVPALQSWWIMIHVISSVVAYAAGSLAAAISLLYLFRKKSGMSESGLIASTSIVSGVMFFILGRGMELLTSGAYRVKLFGAYEGEWMPAAASVDGAFAPWYQPMPGVGGLMIATILVACGLVGGYLFHRRKERTLPTLLKYGAILLFVLTSGSILCQLYWQLVSSEVVLDTAQAASLTAGAPAPWRFHVRSNPWDMALFLIIWFGQLLLMVRLFAWKQLNKRLPKAATLESASYYCVVVAFSLVGVVLVTGALWAHYAWGRYWGWDPKETGALVIWLVYALYLHMRHILGWSGVPQAVVGVIGFFVIIASFLGVNLGWFASGLHSYGSA